MDDVATQPAPEPGLSPREFQLLREGDETPVEVHRAVARLVHAVALSTDKTSGDPPEPYEWTIIVEKLDELRALL